jgi:hypothetical protein
MLAVAVVHLVTVAETQVVLVLVDQAVVVQVAVSKLQETVEMELQTQVQAVVEHIHTVAKQVMAVQDLLLFVIQVHSVVLVEQ